MIVRGWGGEGGGTQQSLGLGHVYLNTYLYTCIAFYDVHMYM